MSTDLDRVRPFLIRQGLLMFTIMGTRFCLSLKKIEIEPRNADFQYTSVDTALQLL